MSVLLVSILLGQLRNTTLPFRRQFRGDFIEVGDALEHVGQGIFPMVFVLDRKNRLHALAVNFREHSLDVAHAGPPGNVVRGGAEFVQILEMERDDSAFQFFQTLERY